MKLAYRFTRHPILILALLVYGSLGLAAFLPDSVLDAHPNGELTIRTTTDTHEAMAAAIDRIAPAAPLAYLVATEIPWTVILDIVLRLLALAVAWLSQQKPPEPPAKDTPKD